MSKYSEEIFRDLVDTLNSSPSITALNKSQLIECMRLVSEALVWSEQNHSNFFELFQGADLLAQYLTYLQQTDDKSIILQVLQSANMLIHNLKNLQNKEYLLNHTFYKVILKHSFDFSDEEVTENFVSLIKGLAVNLPIPQLKSYLTNNDFNLFTAATMFMNHSEWLIKTASKTTILKILSLKDDEIENFILKSGYFYNLISYFKESILSIVKLLSSTATLKRLEEALQDCTENIYFFNDIFDLNNEILTNKFSDTIIHHFVIPLLLASLIESDSIPIQVPANISLYIISQIIARLTYKPVVLQIQTLLFSDRISQNLCDMLKSPPNRYTNCSSTNKSLTKNPIRVSIFNYLSHSEDNNLGLCLYIIHISFAKSFQDFLSSTDEASHVFYEKLLDSISHLLIAQDTLRFFSLYFAAKLIFDLSAAKDKSSEYHREQEIVKFALQKKSLNLVKTAELTQNKIQFIRTFESQWEFIHKLHWIEILELPISYLASDCDKNTEIPLQYRNSISQEDVLVTEIRVFLLVRKLKYLIIRCEVHELFDPFENPLKVLNKCVLEVNKSYYLNTGFLKGKNVYEVKEKGKRVIVDDNQFFILGEKNTGGKTLVIQNIIRFSYLKIKEPDTDKTITLIQENSSPISFYIEDYFLCTDLRSSIKSRISNCIDSDISLIKSFIHDTR